MIILAASSIVWATQDAKDAFGDGFRRIDVLHKVEDLNFLEVVRTFPALSKSGVSVVSTSDEGSDTGADKAIDSDIGTRWASAQKVDPSGLTIDLGPPYSFTLKLPVS